MNDRPGQAPRFDRTPVDAGAMRAQNSGLLVQLIWAEREISRAELSRRTGLSPSTVSLIVHGLSRSRLVREIGPASSLRGRRPTLLSFCDDVHSILGVEIGIRHVAVVITDLRGKARAFRSERHEMREGPDGTLAMIGELVREVLRGARVPRRRVLGVGVGVPSPVDPTVPGRLSDLLYPKWAGVDVAERLEKLLRRPVRVDNDANLGALAEHWWGAGIGTRDLAYIKIGAGLGSGHIMRGELYRGASGTVGEIGHVTVDPRGNPCACGGRGCLTTLVGSDALVEQARTIYGIEGGSVDFIVRRALEGEQRALRLLEEVAEQLGQVIVGSLINVLNPSLIVLGGELSNAAERLLDPLRQYVRRRCWSSSFDTSRLIWSRLGPKAIPIGAATLVLDAALRQPERFLLTDGAAV